MLIPYIGGRVAFVHQSVTEYLAATELARQYQASPHILKEKLSLTRWDQALFLTLSLLPPMQADVFLQDVIKADFALALNATKYLETGRDEIVSKLLSEIPKRIQALKPFDFEIAWAVGHALPITDAHEPHLRRLIKCGNILGGAASLRLVELKGAEVKDELLQLLVDHSDDYNFCDGIGRALRPFATDEDAKKIAAWADTIQDKVTPETDDDDTDGFISGAAEFLAGIDLSVIRREFLPVEDSVDIPEIHSRILCDILQERHSSASLDFAGELLLRGVKDAAVAIYFISEFGKPDCELSWASFTPAHVLRLVEAILDPDGSEDWAVKTLKVVCAARPDLAEAVTQRASKTSGIERAALLYCVSPTDFTPVFQALGELIKMSKQERREHSIRILDQMGLDELDWTGKEDLFVQLLRLRDIPLASALFGGAVPTLDSQFREPKDRVN